MKLSDLIIQHKEVDTFVALEKLVAHLGESGEMFLEYDLKPDYRDTPKRWEWQLEGSFYRGIKHDEEEKSALDDK